MLEATPHSRNGEIYCLKDSNKDFPLLVQINWIIYYCLLRQESLYVIYQQAIPACLNTIVYPVCQGYPMKGRHNPKPFLGNNRD